VAEIAKAFEALNPYDRVAVPASILKIEGDNFDPVTGEQRQLWCLAISAKRYALFLRDDHGEPQLLRPRRGQARPETGASTVFQINDGRRGEDVDNALLLVYF
jgi:hypothetical protein